MTKSVFSDRYSQFLAIIVQARKDKGLTQTDLANRLGKPQSYISKIERGERRVDVVELIDLSLAIGIDPRKIIDTISPEQ